MKKSDDAHGSDAWQAPEDAYRVRLVRYRAEATWFAVRASSVEEAKRKALACAEGDETVAARQLDDWYPTETPEKSAVVDLVDAENPDESVDAPPDLIEFKRRHALSGS